MQSSSTRLYRRGLAIALRTLPFFGPLAGLMLVQGVQADDTQPMRFTGSAVEARGQTGGEENLTRIAARDRRRKLCLGFSTSAPSHVLVLPDNQARLRIAVDSDGSDTTLLIRGPRGIDCNDNARRNSRDAAVADTNWPAGKYEIWVGAYSRGDRLNYTLNVSAPSSNRVRNLSKGHPAKPDNRPDEGVGAELTRR